MKKLTLLPALALAIPLLGASNPAAAETGVGGNSNLNAVVLNNNNNWFVLTSVMVNFAELTNCTVTGSADAINPLNGNGNQYRFALKVDGIPAGGNTVYERTVEFDNDPLAEGVQEVSSTGLFTIAAGAHTFQWMARQIGGAANMTVDDSSMTFVCFGDPMFPLLGNSVSRFVD
jgi:hypothetical protein